MTRCGSFLPSSGQPPMPRSSGKSGNVWSKPIARRVSTDHVLWLACQERGDVVRARFALPNERLSRAETDVRREHDVGQGSEGWGGVVVVVEGRTAEPAGR